MLNVQTLRAAMGEIAAMRASRVAVRAGGG